MKILASREKLITPEQRRKLAEKNFKPLAVELGWLLYEWNRLHESLAEIFAAIVCPNQAAVALAVWHSVRSDLAQREMLLAAVNRAYPPNGVNHANLTWLLNKTKSLSFQRNDAIHAPLMFLTRPDGIELLPLYFFGNPRARSLVGKDLLKEIKWYRSYAQTLATYAAGAHQAVAYASDGFSWPDRPQLPHLGQLATPKRLPRRKRAKQPQRLP